MSIEIAVSFKPVGVSTWSRMSISEADYFDEEANEGEPSHIRSIPKHNHAIEYLEDVLECDLDATQIEIEDKLRDKRLTITEVYWNSGNNSVAEVNEFEGTTTVYWELIFYILVSREPSVHEILRMGRRSGFLAIFNHCFIETRPDGTERQLEECVSSSGLNNMPFPNRDTDEDSVDK